LSSGTFVSNALGARLTADAASSTLWPMNRRNFLASSTAAIGAATAAGSVRVSAATAPVESLVLPGDVILFQGDSITDAGRNRDLAGEPNHPSAIGNGYAWMAGSQLLLDQPDLNIFNRGISGNKVPQLAERWDAECINLKPNLLSILIGVNDIWHGLNGGFDGTPESYENDYLSLIERTQQALPDVRLVICEPFVLRCGAVNDNWFPTFDGYRAAAKKVAEVHGAVFVPFHTVFEEASKIAPPEHWAHDGVHPSVFGSALMARTWLRAVGH